MQTWILRYDEGGACLSPESRQALIEACASEPDRPLIVFSHGWNNDFEDATDLYARFLVEFEKFGPIGSNPIFVGITWPSIWFPAKEGPTIASSHAATYGELIDVFAEELKSPRLKQLLIRNTLTTDEARELANLLTPIVKPESREGAEGERTDKDAVFRTLMSMESAIESESYDDLDEVGFVDEAEDVEEHPIADAGARLNTINAVRMASLYLMKDRAGRVGEAGVHSLLRELLAASRAGLHAVGHSFGCKVVLSGVVQGNLPRRLASLLLLQPAISHLSFAGTIPGRDIPGAYRDVPDKVESPIICTYSAHDFPLHAVYHHAVVRGGDVGEIRTAAAPRSTAGNPPNNYAALGGYGPVDSFEHLVDPMRAAGELYDHPKGVRIIAIDGSTGQRIPGHGDIATMDVAWILRTQMMEAGYGPDDPEADADA
jgi:hypothetical protein